MTPTKILHSTGLRIASPLSLAGARGGAAGVFALPQPAGSSGAGGVTGLADDTPGTRADHGDSKTGATDDADKADRAKDGKDADESSAEGAHEGDAGQAEGGAAGEHANGEQAGVPTQPLTIHTLNGLLLTLPATAGPSGQPMASRSGFAGGAGGEPRAQGASPDTSSRESSATDRAASPTEDKGRGEGQAASGSTRETTRESVAAADRQAGAGAPERTGGRERTTQATPERPERPGAASPTRIDAAAAPAAPGETKANSPIGPHPANGRAAAIGQVGGPRKGEAPMRPGVPSERTGPAQVVRGVLAAVNQRGGKVTLDLEPGELGRMRVELRLDARSATATFHVDSPQARRLLEEAMPLLRQALTDRGVSLERAEVVMPSVELPGALAAIQAGAQAVALVMPEEVDVRTDGKRSNGDPGRADAGDVERGGAGGDGDSEQGAPGVRVHVIGPEGVDVTA